MRGQRRGLRAGLLLVALLAAGCGGGGNGDSDDATIERQVDRLEDGSTTTATKQEEPVETTAPPTTLHARSVENEPPGLFCRDLAARGFGYAAAVSYWRREGVPSRMDEDGNRIPCETVYPASDVDAFWGGAAGGCETALAERAIADSGATAVTGRVTYLRCAEGFGWATYESPAVSGDVASALLSIRGATYSLLDFGTGVCPSGVGMPAPVAEALAPPGWAPC